MASLAAVNDNEVSAIEDLYCGGHQGMEGRHAGDACDAGTIEAGVALLGHVAWEAEWVRDVDDAVSLCGEALLELALVGGGGPYHEDQSNGMRSISG
jgi:hypothetical protein